MSKWTKDEKIAATLSACVGGLFFLWRAMANAKTPPTGEVYIGPVSVTHDDHPVDASTAALTATVKKAHDLMDVDLDAWVPRRNPGLVDGLVIESIINQQTAAGESYTARDLAELLQQARQLPLPSTANV